MLTGGNSSNVPLIAHCGLQVNHGLSERRTKIEELHTVRSLLTKLQFLIELPTYIQKCTKVQCQPQNSSPNHNTACPTTIQLV